MGASAYVRSEVPESSMFILSQPWAATGRVLAEQQGRMPPAAALAEAGKARESLQGPLERGAERQVERRLLEAGSS